MKEWITERMKFSGRSRHKTDFVEKRFSCSYHSDSYPIGRAGQGDERQDVEAAEPQLYRSPICYVLALFGKKILKRSSDQRKRRKLRKG